MKNIQITGWCSRFIEEQVQEGDLCIDATAGNGSDTLLLSRLCGSTGHVLAFDIQRDALDHTKEKLLKESPFQNCKCILDSHIYKDKNKYARSFFFAEASEKRRAFVSLYLQRGRYRL